jgi:renalase
MNMLKSRPHIAVIGAGMAGLACATALQNAQCVVTVFDKSHRPAGRMSTRHDGDWQCDHGAQYFTARDPVFRAELARWIQAGAAAAWEPRLAVLDDTMRPIYPTRPGKLERFVGTPSMTSPGDLLAASLVVRTQSTIVELRREARYWHLHTTEHGGVHGPFDSVVLAVPAPQAAPLLRDVAPEFAAVANGTLMRGCWALMLRFAETVGLPFDAAFVNHGPLRWVARNSSKPTRNQPESWILHATAEWSEAHPNDRVESVAALMLKEFARIGGPSPVAWIAHRWRYAQVAPTDATAPGFAWSGEYGLGLCGDWLNSGRVEGAWLSGKALAEEIVRSLGLPRSRQ